MDKILFHSTSFNFSFLRVILQFSSSLSNFLLLARVSPHLLLSILSILLLSLSPRHILSVFLVFVTVPRNYRLTMSIELILVPNKILLFRSSRIFLQHDSAHPIGVSCLLSNGEPLANEAEDAAWTPCASALIVRKKNCGISCSRSRDDEVAIRV